MGGREGGGEVREWEEGCRGRSRVESTPLAGMIELGSYSVVSLPEKELYRAALEVKAARQKFRVHMHLAMHFPCGSDVSAAAPLWKLMLAQSYATRDVFPHTTSGYIKAPHYFLATLTVQVGFIHHPIPTSGQGLWLNHAS